MVDTNGKSAASILTPLTMVNLDPEDSPWDGNGGRNGGRGQVDCCGGRGGHGFGCGNGGHHHNEQHYYQGNPIDSQNNFETYHYYTNTSHGNGHEQTMGPRGNNPFHLNAIQTIRVHPHAGDARGLAVAWPTHPTKGLEVAWLHRPTKGLEVAWPHHLTKGLEVAWPHHPTHGAVT